MSREIARYQVTLALDEDGQLSMRSEVAEKENFPGAAEHIKELVDKVTTAIVAIIDETKDPDAEEAKFIAGGPEWIANTLASLKNKQTPNKEDEWPDMIGENDA